MLVKYKRTLYMHLLPKISAWTSLLLTSLSALAGNPTPQCPGASNQDPGCITLEPWHMTPPVCEIGAIICINLNPSLPYIWRFNNLNNKQWTTTQSNQVPQCDNGNGTWNGFNQQQPTSIISFECVA